jgi:hypothetical protein
MKLEELQALPQPIDLRRKVEVLDRSVHLTD